MLRNTLIFLSENSTARSISMRAPGARTMARRFVAGETLEEGLAAARTLVDAGFNVSLDYLGESVRSREEARAASSPSSSVSPATKRRAIVRAPGARMETERATLFSLRKMSVLRSN